MLQQVGAMGLIQRLVHDHPSVLTLLEQPAHEGLAVGAIDQFAPQSHQLVCLEFAVDGLDDFGEELESISEEAVLGGAGSGEEEVDEDGEHVEL